MIRDAKSSGEDMQSPFESRENMMDEKQTKEAAEQRVGKMKPQVARVDQKGKAGSNEGDEFIQQQKRTTRGGGYVGTSEEENVES